MGKKLKKKDAVMTEPAQPKPLGKGKLHKGRLKLLIAILPIILLTFFAFSGALNHEFLNIDDQRFISNNEMVTEGSWTNLKPAFEKQLFSPHYKPLVYYSWIIEKELFGMDPFYFHLDNILLHIVNCLLLFFILKILLAYFDPFKKQATFLAFLIVLIFALHPLRVESVVWAVERKDVLFAFFYFAGIWSYLKYLKHDLKPAWLAATTIAYLLCLLSKSMGITLIAVLFLIDLLAARKFSKKILLEKAGLLIVLAIGVFLYGLIIKFDVVSIGLTEGILSEEQLVIEPESFEGLPAWYKQILAFNYRFLFFILHIFVPVKLAIVYPRAYLIDLVGKAIHLLPWINAGMAIVIVVFRKRMPYLFFGFLFYVLTILPALLMGDKGTNFLSDRYTYLPTIGILIMVVPMLYMMISKFLPIPEKYKMALASLIFIPLMLGTMSYTSIWQNNETLNTDVINKYPGMVETAYRNRARHYRENGEYAKAMADYVQLESMKIGDAPMFGVIANLHAVNQNFDKALEYYSKSIQIDPEYDYSYLNRGITYAKMKSFSQAYADFERSHQLDSTKVELYEMWAMAKQQEQDYNGAVELYSYLIDRFEQSTKYYFARGLNRFNARQFTGALMDFQKVVEKEPNNRDALHNVSASYFHLGQFNDALEFEIKAQTKGYPTDPAYMNNIRSKILN